MKVIPWNTGEGNRAPRSQRKGQDRIGKVDKNNDRLKPRMWWLQNKSVCYVEIERAQTNIHEMVMPLRFYLSRPISS